MEDNNIIDDDSTSTATPECVNSDTFDYGNALQSNNMCISCINSHRAVAFVPCAHYVMCLACGSGTTQCP
ncbi:unnamed protein product, partial [Rotaria magnacalcarata]